MANKFIVSENCAVLGYYAASSGNSLPTFRENLSLGCKELGVYTYSRTQLYLPYYNDMFRPYMWAIFRL